MPTPRNAIPSRKLHLALPAEVGAALDLHLFSEVEGRIPKGSHARFLSERIREYLEWGALDLAPYLQDAPPGSVVWGPRGLVDLLRNALQGIRYTERTYEVSS